MKYLEVILQFLISMARIVFPRRKKTDDDRYPSADPLPDPPLPALPVERRDGSDAGSPWSDPFPPVVKGREDPDNAFRSDASSGSFAMRGDDGSSTLRPLPPAVSSNDYVGREGPGGRQLALRETFPKTDWLGISGYTLMLAGAAACVLKAL